MTKKLRILIGINVLLLSAVAISLQVGGSNEGGNTNLGLFSFADTAAISEVKIGNTTLVRGRLNTWTINDRYRVQPSQIRRLLAVIQRLETKREVLPENQATVKQALEARGKTISISTPEGIAKSFSVLLEDGQEVAMGADGVPYSVYVPGSVVNLANIFAPQERAWRDKRIMLTSWRTIQSLKVDYPSDPQLSFTLKFDSVFLSVPGVEALDSAAAMNYLRNFQSFQAESFIQKDAGLKDSLSAVLPFCTFTLDDALESRSETLRVYPAPEVFYGTLEKSGEMVTIRPEMMRRIVVSKDAFRRKEK